MALTLTANNITKTYGNQEVLDHLSISLDQGEIVGLVGRNGVGKSTLLKILSGINLPDSGTVNLNNLKIGFLSERNPMYPFMYVREYLEWIAKISETKDVSSRIEWCITQVGLQDVIGKKVHQLSKGFKQRLGLAATILPNPDVLMLDEPISGLDPIQIEEYRSLIRSMAKDKVIILSSHLLSEIETLCDRVIMLKEGQISEDRKLSQAVFKILKLIVSAPIEVARFEKLEGVEQVQNELSNTYLIACSEDVDIRLNVFDEVVAAGEKILEMTYEKSSLNELFL